MKLELDGLTKEFGDFTAVNHIDLTMTNGVYGLLGVNGAGKTTLMRMLCTLLKPTSGTIYCNGKDIFSMDSEYRKLLGYLPQEFGFYPEFTVEDYLLYIAALKGIRPVVAKKRVKELIAKVGLSKVANKKMKKLSGGMKRRAGIAQAMLNNPKILILDEPTAGLDPNERIRFRNLISELSEDRLVLLSTHIVSDIEYIANEILLMKDGKLMHKGTADEIINSMTETVWECFVEKNMVSDFMKNDFAIDNISDDEASTVYERRISTLKEYLDSGEETFTEKEKSFLIQQYENLDTPFYYEYMDGWSALLQNISTFILILALVIGFFVSGIFSDEFQTKADSIFFSTRLGRNKGVLSKIGAGLTIVSAFYAAFVFLYTFIVLSVLGTDGANCPIQLDLWRSAYNVTFLQAYLLIVAGGYIGTLFASMLAMLASALTRSTPTAIIVPFIILCAFPFLSRIITLPGLCSFFPDQLLEIYLDIKEAGLVTLGGKVTTIATVIVPVYAVICLILLPILYKVYKKTEIK